MAPRDEILADAVLAMVAWFDLVDDDTLHPALAVKALEEIDHLHRLEGGDRSWLAAYARQRILSERDPRFRSVYEAVADDLLDDGS